MQAQRCFNKNLINNSLTNYFVLKTYLFIFADKYHTYEKTSLYLHFCAMYLCA